MADLSAPRIGGTPDIRASYLALTRTRRMYSGLTILVFVVLMISGFQVVEERSAGGFWDGLPQIFDFPAGVVSEAWEKRAELPGLLLRYLPPLIETINIAAVSPAATP
jgi:phosphonate transport system permease protein